MGEMVLDLASIGQANMDQTGGKARALGQMTEAGFPVPGGFVILPAAFEETGLTPAAAAEVRQRLGQWHTAQPDTALAVRSSGLEEDSATAAFAGEFTTLLNVRGTPAIMDAIPAVYASRHQAQAYRKARVLVGPQVMAVIVQHFIAAECSGVSLSVDPVGPDHARLRALPDTDNFLSRLDEFLALYGDRTGAGAGSEGTLYMPTLREQPEAVLRLIAPYLDARMPAPAVARQCARAARDALLEALCGACPDAEAVAEFRREWRWAVLHAARWLCARGRLGEVDSVFWLTFAEISAALRTDEPGSFEAVIAARQAQHAAWEQLVPQPFLGLPPKELAVRTRPGEPAAAVVPPGSPPLLPGQFKGLGASAGQAQCRARLLHSGDVSPAVQPGDIVVARTAGPLWTPFFLILGGLVLEYAAVGQHAAATAREYGIPAVINCREVMRHIQDGGVIHIDGTTGIVTLKV